MVVYFKKGVKINGVQPEIAMAFPVIAATYHAQGYDCIITSCCDGEHSDNSFHYVGLAIDVRTRIVPTEDQPALRDALASNLGDEFDVVLESDHMHIEFDPE